jgi:hypothetical protein
VPNEPPATPGLPARARGPAILVALAVAAAAIYLLVRRPTGAVVARSTSPDGRRVLVVRESPPRFLMESPYTYTVRAERAQGGAALGETSFENDSASIDDFAIVWSVSSVSIGWSRDRMHVVGVFAGERVDFHGP